MRPEDLQVQELLAFSPQDRSHLPYPERTPECPSLPRFAQAALSGWRGDERSHVSGCDHCQHLTAKQWLITPPKPLTLALYRAGQSPDEEAMAIYLSWRESNDARRLLRESLYVRALAEIFRGAKVIRETGAKAGTSLSLDSLVFDLGRMATGTAPTRSARQGEDSGPGVTPSIQDTADSISTGHAETAGSTEKPLRVSTRDRSVTAELSQSTEHSIRVAVGSYSGRRRGNSNKTTIS